MQVENWDRIKVDVMRAILKAKVSQHPYVRKKLLERRFLGVGFSSSTSLYSLDWYGKTIWYICSIKWWTKEEIKNKLTDNIIFYRSLQQKLS